MKILIVNTLYSPNVVGGAEKSVQLLAEKLVSLGNQVKVLCLGRDDLNYNLNGVDIVRFKLENIYWPFENESRNKFQKFFWHLNDCNNKKYDNKFNEILNDFEPHILFTNNLSGFSTNIWSIAKKHNVRIVHTLRDYYLQCVKSTKFKNSEICINSCNLCSKLSKHKKNNSDKIDFVIGISNFILEDHITNSYFKSVPSKVIFNGFDTAKVNINKQIKKNIVFGYIGQINQSKGVELLLQSLKNLENKDWKLLIAGKINDTYEQKLSSINNSSKIEYLGYTDSKQFFSTIDVLVVPSIWNEPFGRVVLESYIHKVPVLASNVGGITELMEINQDFLFEPNEKSLHKKLTNIILDKSFLSTFDFNLNFIDRFSVDKIINQYLEIFNSLIDES